jgi:staphyloferrin B biosynthesis citrate synthase
MPDQTANPIRARMLSGDVALGMTARLSRSGEIARIARGSGHDFVRIDCQHAIYDLETIGHIAQTALACEIGCVVRVRGFDDPDVGRLLDAGVTGIVFPDVETAQQARLGVDQARFPPVGKRSAGGGYPQFDYRPMPVAEAMRLLNDATVVVCMIESVEGLRNIQEIAAVDGVDVLHVGLNDLMVDMGIPAQPDDVRVKEALRKVVSVAKQHGKFAGCGGTSSLQQQRDILQQGFRFLTTKSDLGFLAEEATRWIEALRPAAAADAQPRHKR